GFRLAIDRAFTLPGIGLVVTGTAAAGTVTVGDRLCVSPRGVEVRVRGIHAHNRPIEVAVAGERCALNLAGSFPEGAEPLWGDWAILRDHMARHTLAGGRVLDPGPPRRGRQRPERLATLRALAEPDPGDALECLLDDPDGPGIVVLAPFALARNLPQSEVE